MPHSSFKRKVTDNGAGVGRCPCGQTFECASERELAMKHRIHRRFCSNDLTHKSSKSEDVFKELKQASDSLLELENVNEIFLCNVLPRLDNEAVDVKVNELNCQITNHAIAKSSNQLVIINFVNRECKNFNKYGLHFSQVGMQCTFKQD